MQFLNTVNQFISGKEYANKGIRTSDGTLAYVTSTGITKQYASLEDSTSNVNCSTEFVDIDKTWQNLGFPIGSLMVSGQSCGNEGTYARAQPPATDFDWQFYLQNNPDLASAGITTQQQATDHWNSNGKSEGRAPNATIFSTMGMLGNVGYIDVDTVFHSVQPNYATTYTTFPNQSNLTGTSMTDCSTPLPLVNYGEPVVLMQNNQPASLNTSGLLQFGTETTNLFLRPPPGEDLTGTPVKVGDSVCISSSASSYTTDCGWWGCKVGTVNNQMQLFFDSGGDDPSLFTIISSKSLGTPLRLSDTFTLRNIPQINKAKIPKNSSVKCAQGRPPGDNNGWGVYRYSGNNELNHYPTADIASSWDKNWRTDTIDVDCSTYKFGDALKKNTFNFADAVLKNNANDGSNHGLDETSKDAYVYNGIMMFGEKSEANGTLFSFQLTNYSPNCDIENLKNICNSQDCLGFVQSPANYTWQMITSKSSSGDYKIVPTTQDYYLRDATVDLSDNSCDPGPVSFIKGSLLENYPQGDAFIQGGTGQCKVINAPMGKVTNYVKKARKIVKEFPNLSYNTQETETLKEKTKEYRQVLKNIKKMGPSNTLDQQYTDMTVFDEQNKNAMILWSVLSIGIIGFVIFRMKS